MLDAGGTPRHRGEKTRTLFRLTRRIFRLWLEIELSASILALIIIVAVVPLVVVLLSDPALPVPALIGVLAVSVPLAVLLGTSALKLGRQVSG